ncbi:unnamed protein product [Tilletia controversa]|uniref:Phosphatidylinositol-specific phospholipase C X domain-containing protein n=3 Tax=Tilletia TaxID=13289 RepID=A0A8X7MY20_9BASI|nr:hypothetical protein CF336_g685 [Tilletia laevis]KAE8204282.1 hypothetical protein CF328_g1171 [Tilletia controversa]KAE8265259.1 hypothetical protein A4X03_0g387 [Tilletia caries]KAE8208577.1 hypothetical protein CF335_g303 [Tilletia laevis]KAE8253194.1 hypothetical protein A4X06_0g1629 [Tilletia controversa]
MHAALTLVLSASLLIFFSAVAIPTAEALPVLPLWFSSVLSHGRLPAAKTTTPPILCNGFADNCSKQYSNFTVIGTHNSYAINKFSLSANQDVSITAQLNAGIRMLQSQAHRSPNKTATGAGIDLCHTNCLLFQGGSLESYLSEVKAWVDEHPTEVISLLIVNSDDLPASRFGQAYEASGLATKSYRPTITNDSGIARADWPTLGDLISADTPVVNFLASGADLQSVPYLIDEFSSMFENAYDQTRLPFNCSVDRIASGSKPDNLMYIANHFKDSRFFGSPILIPDKFALRKTNAREQVLADANHCASIYGRWPTAILVDFFDWPKKKGPLTAVAQMNRTPWTSNSTGVSAGPI